MIFVSAAILSMAIVGLAVSTMICMSGTIAGYVLGFMILIATTAYLYDVLP